LIYHDELQGINDKVKSLIYTYIKIPDRKLFLPIPSDEYAFHKLESLIFLTLHDKIFSGLLENLCCLVTMNIVN